MVHRKARFEVCKAAFAASTSRYPGPLLRPRNTELTMFV